MKRKSIINTGILFLLFFTARAQYQLPENNIWKFGNGAGYDFNTNTAISSQINSNECANSVCDASGNLLFYTDGHQIWDRNDQLMPGANPVFPGASDNATKSTAQGALIVADPGNNNRYYLFSLTSQELVTPGGGRLYYSIVDMTLRSGLGDIVSGLSAIQVDTGLSEHMIAIPACDGVWVVLHDRATPVFKTIKVTENGVNGPVVSASGIQAYAPPRPASGYNGNNFYIVGQLAVATDSRQLAAAYFLGNCVELYDFDVSTGRVSNARIIDSLRDVYSFYGVCFSPDNSRLYSASCAANSSLKGFYQYNLTLPTSQQIRGSRQYVGACNAAITQMQLGPDGRIYFNGNYISRMGVIRNPNALGTACDLDLQGITLINGTNTLAGFHNTFMKPIPMSPDTIGIVKQDTIICQNETITLHATPGTDIYTWDDGSSLPSRTVSTAGKYWLQYIRDCQVHIDSFIVAVKIPDTIGHHWLDTLICKNDVAVLHIRSGIQNHTWDNGSTQPSRQADQPGKYWLYYLQDCRIHVDTFTVGLRNDSIRLGSDTIVCGSYNLYPEVTRPPASYLWQDGTTGDFYPVETSGTYHVTANINGCTLSDTIAVSVIRLAQELGEDLTLCADDPVSVSLKAVIPEGGSVLWSNGSTDSVIIAEDFGEFRVTTSHPLCGSLTSSIYIDSMYCGCNVAIPNIFTPNGDGVNDQFGIIRLHEKCSVNGFRLQIYNRWGQCVFTSDHPDKRWDGNYNGIPQNTGAYIYELRLRKDLSGEIFYKKGNLTLIR